MKSSVLHKSFIASALMVVLLLSFFAPTITVYAASDPKPNFTVTGTFKQYVWYPNKEEGSRKGFESPEATMSLPNSALPSNNLQSILECIEAGKFEGQVSGSGVNAFQNVYELNKDAPISITFSTRKQYNDYGNVVNTINKKVVFTRNKGEAELGALDGDDVITIYNGSDDGITITSTPSRKFQAADLATYPPEVNEINFQKGLEINGGASVSIVSEVTPSDKASAISTHCLKIKIGGGEGEAKLAINDGTLNISGYNFDCYSSHKATYNFLTSTYLIFEQGSSMTIGKDGSVTVAGAQVEDTQDSNNTIIENAGSLTITEGKKQAPSNVLTKSSNSAVKCSDGSSLTITGKSAVKSGEGGNKAVELAPGAKVTTDAVKDLTVAEDMVEAYVDNNGKVIQKADENDLPAFTEPVEVEADVKDGVVDKDDKLKEAAGNVGAELPTDAQTAAAHEWAHDKADEAKKKLGETEEDVNIYVLTTVETTVEDFKADTALTLDITPRYEVIATTAGTKDGIHLEAESGQEKNAVLLDGGALEVNRPVEMVIPIPNALYHTVGTEATPSFVVLHEHEGKVYLYHATYSSTSDVGAHITFTNEHGFSKFTVIVVRQGSLSNLTASVGSMETFDPSKEEKSYTVNVPYSVSELELTATTAVQDDEVTAKLGEGEDAIVLSPEQDETVTDKDVYTISVPDLAVGDNTVTITVTHGETETTYTVTINRAAYVPPVPPSYTVSAEEAENAEVELSTEKATAGDSVTVTVTPAENFHVSGVTVTGADGKEITVVDNGDGTFTFTMPSGGVTVKAETFKCPSVEYTDIDVTEWYHDYVDYAITHDLMDGFGDGVFAPEKTVTRAQMAGILWNLEGQPVVNYLMTFTDVPDGKWYTEAIRWAASEGIISGFGDDTFRPEDIITREQMAAMLYFYEEYKNGDHTVDAELTFTDSGEVSSWANEAVVWCVGKDLIHGKGDNAFDPRGTSIRAQLATLLALYDQMDK